MLTLSEHLLELYLQGASDDAPVYIEDEHPVSGLLEED